MMNFNMAHLLTHTQTHTHTHTHTHRRTHTQTLKNKPLNCEKVLQTLRRSSDVKKILKPEDFFKHEIIPQT